MAFDLSAVLNQATEVSSSSSQDGGSENKIRLIYPGPGTLKVKLLYNPKSNLVARQISRHKISGSNYTCLSMYGVGCPICQAIDSIKNSTGSDFWQYNAKLRGLSYAQYVGCESYKWDNDNPEPQIGELILLMYPWSVYRDINRLLSTAGTHASELIASNTGKPVSIIRWRENSRENYKAEIDAFSSYTSFNTPDGESQFEKYLNDLPSLNEAIVPSQLNDTTMKVVRDAAETLSREHLKGITQPAVGNLAMNNPQSSGSNANVIDINGQKYVLTNGQYVPVASAAPVSTPVPSSQPAPTTIPGSLSTPAEVVSNDDTPPWQSSPSKVTSANGDPMPVCFGQHKDDDGKCMSCINELGCIAMSSK